MFLAQLEKFLETVVELFLGGMVIIYGVKRLSGSTKFSYIFVGLVTFALFITFGFILAG